MITKRNFGNKITLQHYSRRWLGRRQVEKFSTPFKIQKYFNPMLKGHKQVVIADIGSGPFPLVGTIHPTVEIKLIPSDILADEFKRMVTDANITLFIPVEKQDAENLTYSDDLFDIIHCVNALDHMENPRKALMEMHRICKPGGWVYLKHFKNMGERKGYRGNHGWNISGGRVWDQHGSFLLSDILPGIKTTPSHTMTISVWNNK